MGAEFSQIAKKRAEAGSWAANEGVRRSMLGNRGGQTSPELQLRRALHAAGLRYRVSRLIRVAGLRVRPDLTFVAARVAVFVDGCFWHSCPQHGRTPRANSDYWAPKLARNAERDREQDAALAAAGWEIVRVWEHEDPGLAAQRVQAAVRAEWPREQGRRNEVSSG